MWRLPTGVSVMTMYFGKRIGAAIATIFVVSILVFVGVRVLPGNPGEAILGLTATPASIARVDRALNLDRPLLVQYGSWLSGAVRGNLGSSMASAGTGGQFSGTPVSSIVAEGLGVTLPLSILGIILAVFIGLPFGVLAAYKRHTWLDSCIAGLSVLGFALPDFFLSFLLILLFTVKLHLLPSVGYPPFLSNPLGALRSLALGIICIGIINSTSIVRTVRNNTVDAMNSDFVLLAKARGEPVLVQTLKHALRASLIPIVTVIGLQFGYLLGGVVVVENVFSLPGDGTQLLAAVNARDYPTMQALIMLFSIMFILTNLLVELMYPLLDRRTVERVVG